MDKKNLYQEIRVNQHNGYQSISVEFVDKPPEYNLYPKRFLIGQDLTE